MPRLEQLTMPDGTRYSYETLAVAPPDVLEEVMRRGTTPKVDDMVGWEFKGYNTPLVTRIAGIRKFKKGFYRPEGAPAGQEAKGYNVKVVQNHSLTSPWIDLEADGEPVRHGWFEVHPVRMGDEDNRYPNALLLDYGASHANPRFDPSRLLRDYVIQVYEDDGDLLLGKAYLALGFFRVFAGFFVLGRHNEISKAP